MYFILPFILVSTQVIIGFFGLILLIIAALLTPVVEPGSNGHLLASYIILGIPITQWIIQFIYSIYFSNHTTIIKWINVIFLIINILLIISYTSAIKNNPHL